MIMNRRNLLKLSSTILAYSMSGAATAALLGGCKIDMREDWRATVLDKAQLSLVREVAERIIPKTDTPGAKEAMVERYIDMALINNYTLADRMQFLEDLKIFNRVAELLLNKTFIECKHDEQEEILAKLFREKLPIIFELKSLTVSGFLTSKEGATMALKYDPVPGEYISCLDLSAIGGRWAY